MDRDGQDKSCRRKWPRNDKDGAKIGQDGAKMGPEWAQDGATMVQDGAEVGQDGAKMGPRWAKVGQDGPTEVAKTGQDGAKMRPRREKMSPTSVAIAGRFAVFAKLEQLRGKEGPRMYVRNRYWSEVEPTDGTKSPNVAIVGVQKGAGGED